MAKPLIEIKDLRKVYRIGAERVVALNRMSLDIYEGEICCLLGTSGSGKSTLLNMMAGLEKPTSGSIVIDKNTITSMTEKELAVFRQGKIGFVFQSYNLLPSMTALENVAMPLLFLGDSKKDRNSKAKAILKSVGLEKHMHHRPTQMSGGQQQRVGIARAFVNMPKIVFADEPTGNLDSKTTVEVMAIIINLAKKLNQTLIIVTHDPSIAKYADRIVHILDGNIEKVELNETPIVPEEPHLKDHLVEPEKEKSKVKTKGIKPAKSAK
ncbi:MAG: ABC transporter ATP-binding protein [Oscillospiraceae bacterium]